MAEIKHVHRLAGLEGEIDALRSDWRKGGDHLVLWRATGPEDSEVVTARLEAAQGEMTLDYLALSGDAGEGKYEVVERDTVEIVEVRLEEGHVCATLRLRGQES